VREAVSDSMSEILSDAVSDIKCDAESDVMSCEMSNAVTSVDIESDKRHCVFWNITLWKMKKKCLNTYIYFYLQTSGGQSSNLHLNVVDFFNTSVNKTSVSLRQLFSCTGV